MQRDDRQDGALVTGIDDVAIVVQRVLGEVSLFGFDARPLDRESIRVEAE